MIYYVVIDTNVLVSAMLSAVSVPGAVVVEALDGCILLNDAIVSEYREVLRRAKFRFDQEAVQLLLNTITRRGIFVDAGPVDDLPPDPKDAVFYEVVMEKRKTDDAYLVTGSQKHFPAKPFVVTPRELLDLMRKRREG